MTSNPRPLEEYPDLLTVAETAEILRCSPNTVRNRIAEGSLPKVQPGGRGARLTVPKRAIEHELERVAS